MTMEEPGGRPDELFPGFLLAVPLGLPPGLKARGKVIDSSLSKEPGKTTMKKYLRKRRRVKRRRIQPEPGQSQSPEYKPSQRILQGEVECMNCCKIFLDYNSCKRHVLYDCPVKKHRRGDALAIDDRRTVVCGAWSS